MHIQSTEILCRGHGEARNDVAGECRVCYMLAIRCHRSPNVRRGLPRPPLGRGFFLLLPPSPIAPRCQRMTLGLNVRWWIVPERPAWPTPREPRQRLPQTAPGAVHLDAFQSELRARRQVAAFRPDQRFQSPAINMDRRLRQTPRQHGKRTRHAELACTLAPAFSSTCDSAVSTASNTSSTDAWRPL